MVINQFSSDPSTPYHVPATGTITQWQINTFLDTSGAPVTLVVLRAAGGSGYTVVGVDSRTIPSPPGDVTTFVLSNPIAVQTGDTFGLYTDSSGAVVCYWDGGATPGGAELAALPTGSSPPAQGESLSIDDRSGGGFTMNLAANFRYDNTFTRGETKRNKNKGTATVTFNVPNPGELTGSGGGAKVAGGAVTSKTVTAGQAKLVIRAKGKKKRTLNETGKVKLNVAVTYTPTGGDPSTQSIKVKLKKKL